MSISTENFVKVIYTQKQLTEGDTKPSSLAKVLNITNAATTDMARKLAAKKLVNYNKYKQLSLTPDGERQALSIIRKHRLWEAFLYKTFHLSLHEIHREAEMLEHSTSDFLAEKLNEYLGNPSTDPHGDPIPGSVGDNSRQDESRILSKALPGNQYSICRLFSSDKDFFDFCTDNGINIGAIIRVDKQYEKQHMTEILINNKKLVLNKDFTNIIYVKHKQ